MAAEAALTRSWSVGKYTATLTVQRPTPGATSACVVEWSPSAPKNLSGTEWGQYRAGRNAALADLAAALGINAAVLEL